MHIYMNAKREIFLGLKTQNSTKLYKFTRSSVQFKQNICDSFGFYLLLFIFLTN